MAARTAVNDIRTQSQERISRQQWLKIALTTAAAAIVLVLITQALALAIWPEAASFKPLDSYPRSALFTLVPALAASALLAWLVRGNKNPATSFIGIAVVVLMLSFLPDYLMPDPNKTFLASSIAAFLHLVAGVVITIGLVSGYEQAAKRAA